MPTASRVVQFRAKQTRGQEFPDRDKIVPRKFGAVCKIIWPNKTANELAYIAKADERTAKRWLRGESDPPLSVIMAIFAEMMREQTELNLR